MASVYAVGRNKKSQKRALVVGRQLASQGFIKLVDLLMAELRSGGDLTDYLEADKAVTDGLPVSLAQTKAGNEQR